MQAGRERVLTFLMTAANDPRSGMIDHHDVRHFQISVTGDHHHEGHEEHEDGVLSFEDRIAGQVQRQPHQT